MLYNEEDARELCNDINRYLTQDNTFKNIEDLQKLLRKKDRINLKDQCENLTLGDKILEYAEESNLIEVVRFLLNNGYTLPNNINDLLINEMPFLNYVIEGCGSDMLELLLQKIEEKTSELVDDGEVCKNYQRLKNDALLCAIKKNKPELASILLQYKADPIAVITNSDHSYNINPTHVYKALLIHLIDTCKYEVLELLLKNSNEKQSDLSPNAESYKQYQILKNNALFYAVTNYKPEAIQALKKYGADPEMKDHNGRTVLNIAQEKGYPHMKRILQDFKSQENDKEKNNILNKDQKFNSLKPQENNNEQTAEHLNSSNVQLSQKEINQNFYYSLGKSCVGVLAAGLLVTVSAMVHFIIGVIVFCVLASIVALGAVLHTKNSTIPSYREMKDNTVECINSNSHIELL